MQHFETHAVTFSAAFRSAVVALVALSSASCGGDTTPQITLTLTIDGRPYDFSADASFTDAGDGVLVVGTSGGHEVSIAAPTELRGSVDCAPGGASILVTTTFGLYTTTAGDGVDCMEIEVAEADDEGAIAFSIDTVLYDIANGDYVDIVGYVEIDPFP